MPTAGVWHCLGAAAAPLPLASELFGAGAPSSLGSPERLGEFFDLEFLERKELLISWDDLWDYTLECETEADKLAKKLDVDSKPAKHMEALTRYQQCIQAWEVAGEGSVSVAGEGSDASPEAKERAVALERVWAKYKKVAMGHYGQHLGMANAGSQTFIFDLRDMADAA